MRRTLHAQEIGKRCSNAKTQLSAGGSTASCPPPPAPCLLLSFVTRFGIGMGVAVLGHVRWGHRHGARDRANCALAFKIALHLLVAKVGSFLKLQLLFREYEVIYGQDNRADRLVFALNVESVFPVTGLWNHSQVSHSCHNSFLL